MQGSKLIAINAGKLCLSTPRSVMLPTTTRVTRTVYESLVGAFYPGLVSLSGNNWLFGTGTRHVKRQEAHGFRYGEDKRKQRTAAEKAKGVKRQKHSESAKAILAAYKAAHTMCEHIPAYSKQRPGATPGQLLMTNTNQRNVLSTTLAPKLPPFTYDENASGPQRYSLVESCFRAKVTRCV